MICSRCGSRWPNPGCYVCAEPEDENNPQDDNKNQKKRVEKQTMKRSDRLLKNARRELLMATMFLAAASATGVWSAAVRESGDMPLLGTALLVGTAIALFLCLVHFRETIRLTRLSNIEARWEWERGIRPRI